MQNLSKLAKQLWRYRDFSSFKMAAIYHIAFLKFHFLVANWVGRANEHHHKIPATQLEYLTTATQEFSDVGLLCYPHNAQKYTQCNKDNCAKHDTINKTRTI